MKSITIVIFGATGDLAKRKLIPALYHLIARKKIENFIIVGAAIDDVNVDTMLIRAQEHISQHDESVWDILRDRSFYKRVNFANEQDFDALREYIELLEKQHGFEKAHRLFYCATAPSFFCSITRSIACTRLAIKHDIHDDVWHRIVYEKPFGHDLASAHEINECIKEFFYESQVYRIDHYLTKDVVSNIAMIRFTNIVLEPLWSRNHIDQIQIILSETVGVEMRGKYYDQFGALRDMVQNHILELLALICMESPKKLTGDFIRIERAKVLEKVRLIDGILGQYKGYRQEKDVVADSKTETYAALALAVDTQRWKDVPIYVKTGKCLDKKETVIHIKFKAVECLLLEGCPIESNWLTLRVAPESLFTLTLNAKHPMKDQLVPVDMEFCHSCLFGLQVPASYEVLLSEVIKGEQSVSVRFDEIEYAWRLIDAVEDAQLPLFSYVPSSTGPEEEKEFRDRHTMRWRE